MVDAEAAGVAPGEAAVLAEDPLHARVVALAVEAEPDRAEGVAPVVAPAGERPGLLADVVLVVAAVGAEREELHHLARVVLVRGVARVIGAVQPEQHRGVACDLSEERRERAERVAPEQTVLAKHQPSRTDSLARGGEPVVPHERHPLDQRPARPHHPVQPPQLVVPPRVVGSERATLVVVRARTAQPLAGGMRQRADGAVEPELRERLGLARTRAEPRSPEEPLGLRLAEASSVHRDGHTPALSAPVLGASTPFGCTARARRASTRCEAAPGLPLLQWFVTMTRRRELLTFPRMSQAETVTV